jgi:rSAM/selenodomain-associated transferase 1
VGIHDLLAIFARAPVAGQAKTRLVPRLGSAGAARLALAFLDDTLVRTRGVAEARVIALAGDPRHEGVVRLAAREGIAIAPQPEGDLGARMSSAIASGLAGGASRVVIVGSDAPLVPPRPIVDAFALLHESDVVLGPADDGGYWLVGARRAVPELFAAMPWGEHSVFDESVRRLLHGRISYAMVERFWDVDEPADLDRLRQALLADAGAAPATRAALAAIDPVPC